MDIINDMVRNVPLPKMAPVRQVFDDTALADVEATLNEQFAAANLSDRIEPGDRIALGVGSRGLAQLPLLVRTTVDALKALGAEPFIVPAMGSHGGATAEGQTNVLKGLGVTEESAGCPIHSNMETVELGKLPSGLPILMDRLSMEADGIAFINRVKPHTSFTADYESGLCKMLSIGFGKQRGADSCHAEGFGRMAHNVFEMAKIKAERTKFLFCVATVENAYDKIAIAEVVKAEYMLSREPDLLKIARASMPRVLFTPLDVLVVEKMGKEFSGMGCAPNITGRASTPYIRPEMNASRFAILDLSLKSGGNATGVGMADVITKSLANKIDLVATYANHLTSTTIPGARIPMTLDTARLAVQAAVKTCNGPAADKLRVVELTDTLHLERIMISEALLQEARDHPQLEVLGEAEDWVFIDERDDAMAA